MTLLDYLHGSQAHLATTETLPELAAPVDIAEIKVETEEPKVAEEPAKPLPEAPEVVAASATPEPIVDVS